MHKAQENVEDLEVFLHDADIWLLLPTFVSKTSVIKGWNSWWRPIYKLIKEDKLWYNADFNLFIDGLVFEVTKSCKW